MSQRFVRMISVLLLSTTLLVYPAVLGSGKGTDQQVQNSVQGDIDALLKAYDSALKNELTHGLTQEIVDPSTGITRILVGESQAKMDRLWAETLAKIEALQARSDAERAQTVATLNQISDADPLYVSRARTPYHPAAELEEYEAGRFMYQVDIESEQVVKIWLKNQRDYNVEDLYSEAELADLARNYVANVSPDFSLDRLTLEVLNKDNEVYFFRWQDSNGQTADGTHPFVQVAFSRSGEFLNYENTLPFSLRSTNKLVDRLLSIEPAWAIGANEIYSNGGTRWGWEIQNDPFETCCSKEIAWDEIWDYVP